MAAATAIEIKRAKDQERAANQLEDINARLERIERLLEALTSPPPAKERGRTVQPVTS